MPDKNLTDNEIVKAIPLEEQIEHYNKRLKEVFDWWYRSKNTNGCEDPLEICVLQESARLIPKLNDLINRQNADIERLKDALTDHEYANCVAIKNGLIYTHTLEDYDRLIGDISAEAYKEFAERLKKALYSDSCRLVFDSDLDIFECAIDNLLKELVGEDK